MNTTKINNNLTKNLLILDKKLFEIENICPISLDKKTIKFIYCEQMPSKTFIENLKKKYKKNIIFEKTDLLTIKNSKKLIYEKLFKNNSIKKPAEKNFLSDNSAEKISIFKADSSEATEIVHKIIADAYHENATDIHISVAGADAVVKYRIDGTLFEKFSFHASIFENILTKLKVMAGLDIAQTRLPQSGKANIKIYNDNLSIRVSTLPAQNYEKISIRFLQSGKNLIETDKLGLSQNKITKLLKYLKIGKGIFLIGGPTGSGKTTTLYSIIKELNDGTKNIITLEDPPEISLSENIIQVQVNETELFTFDKAIKAVLRHDPDIILIGEIRTSESAKAAFEAALTGHLVLATIHMPTIDDIIERLMQMQIDSVTINSSLIGVATQRLVRKICPNCSKKIAPSIEAQKFFQQFDIQLKYDYASDGCELCKNRGFIGRCALFDIRISDEIKFEKQNKKTKRINKYNGLALSGLEAINKGLTNAEEIQRNIW